MVRNWRFKNTFAPSHRSPPPSSFSAKTVDRIVAIHGASNNFWKRIFHSSISRNKSYVLSIPLFIYVRIRATNWYFQKHGRRRMEILLRDPSRTFIRCVVKSIGQIRKSSFFLRDVSLGIFHEFLFCFNSEIKRRDEDEKRRNGERWKSGENKKRARNCNRIYVSEKRVLDNGKLNNVSNLRHDAWSRRCNLFNSLIFRPIGKNNRIQEIDLIFRCVSRTYFFSKQVFFTMFLSLLSKFDLNCSIQLSYLATTILPEIFRYNFLR